MSYIGAENIRCTVSADFESGVTTAMTRTGYAVVRSDGGKPTSESRIRFELTTTADEICGGVIADVNHDDTTKGSVIDDGQVWVRVNAALAATNLGSQLSTTTTAGVLKVDNTNGTGRIVNYKTVGSDHYAKWDIRAL